MSEIEYDQVVNRIQSIYNSCSVMEQKQLMQILQEISVKGYSSTLETIYLADFTEVPVSIDEFICSPYYLGNVTRNGDGIYPYWKQTLRKIFNNGNKYNEIILSGATRIGKTSTAVTIGAYMLYRLMLYRNPHEYFKKKQVSKFTIAFANLTKDLAEGVAYREFNDTLKECPYFNDHGAFSRSDRKFYYIPEGDKIDIVAASSASHLLGMQTWFCVVGDTKVATASGTFTIEELSHRPNTYINQYGAASYPAPAKQTRTVHTTCKIDLGREGSIECTPDHKLMNAEGTYVRAEELSPGDRLFQCNYSGTSHLGDLKVERVSIIHHKDPVPVYDIINMLPNHNFVIVAGNSCIVSSNCIMDETNFAKAGVKDINIAKAHMKNLYDTVNARISGTFRVNGEVYGKLVASSSKNSDSDFLSDHIEKQLSAGNEHLLLIDEPQWKILPPSMFSDKKFHFTVGDRYKRGFVIPEENDDEEHRQEYIRQGYKVIEAPAELRKNFLADYDISLRDIAGISVAGSMGFITQEMVTPCVAQDRQNPFFEDILQIGSRDKSVEISDFFHPEVVPQELKTQQMNIHIDLGETKNRTGIAGSCVCGNKIIETEEGKRVAMPYIKEVFAVAIEAPRGDRQSFQKVVNFIIYLRKFS